METETPKHRGAEQPVIGPSEFSTATCHGHGLTKVCPACSPLVYASTSARHRAGVAA